MSDPQQVALAFLFWIFAGIGVPYLMLRQPQGSVRYSLRGLLVATTLVAVVLGLVAWLI
jgi:hypothetical protein